MRDSTFNDDRPARIHPRLSAGEVGALPPPARVPVTPRRRSGAGAEILHVITDLNTGGAELMLLRLVREQSQSPGNPHRHRVISLRTVGPVGERIRAAGIEVEAMAMIGLRGFVRGFPRLVRRIRRVRPDIVQTWMYHADLLGGIAARLAGCRRILWGVRVADIFPAMGVSRSALWSRRICGWLSSRLPNRIVYVAEAARAVHERLGYDSSRSVVVQNGYAVPGAADRLGWRERGRAELGLAPDAVLVGTAGRFSPQKGFRGFIETGAALARSRPGLCFLMAGRGIDRANVELQGWIEATGMAERFHLIGETDDIQQWLATLDVFALKSLGEGFPNIVAEAMTVEVPCVVTDVGDAGLLIGTTGAVTQPGDHRAFSAAIARLVDAPPEEREVLGRAARKRVRQLFSVEDVSARYSALYAELLADGRGAA